MTIRLKLSLATAAILASGLGFLGWALVTLEGRYLREESQKGNALFLQTVRRAAEDALIQKDDLLLVSYIKFLQKQHKSLLYCRIDWHTPGGERVLTLGPPSSSTTWVPSTGARKVEEIPLRVVDPRDPKRFVVLLLGVNMESIEERVTEGISRLQRDLLRVFCIAMILGVLFSDWLARSITQPLRALVSAVGQVGSGKLGTRLEWKSADEVGGLVKGFNQMTQRLEDLDVMKRDFVSSVTHELRSPLGAIESFLRLIETKMVDGRLADPQQVQEYLSRISANVRRLSGFINDLLDVAKIERGKMECVLRPMKIQEVASEVVQFFEAKSKEHRISLASRLPPDLPPIQGDAERLRQVLVNLVANALKFTPDGGQIWLQSEIFREGERRWVEVAVTDTGRGMAPQDLAGLFQKFQQGRNVSSGVVGHKGTGLGLFIVKSIVEAHGGKVGVKSLPGKGTQFAFNLRMA